EVLTAAGTKWNFLPFRPGLVGGHCIGVDPYYLTYKAELAGYHPEVILAGRRINDNMGPWIARKTVQQMIHQGRSILGAKVNILGLTFKEDCKAIRKPIPTRRSTNTASACVPGRSCLQPTRWSSPSRTRPSSRARPPITWRR